MATWSEFDFDAKVWNRPASHMKPGYDHSVPLTDEMVALLPARGAPDELVFPGIGKNGMSKAIGLLGYVDEKGKSITVHGFRASFSSWAGARTAHSEETVEVQLSHRLPKVRGAYMRDALMDKRRQLCEAWTRFCLEGAAVEGDNVVAIGGRA